MTAPITPWRLFLDDAHSGARNMAIDEAMLLAHAHHFAPPTLRFYGWNPACLSLGRLQKQWPEGVSPEGVSPEGVSPEAKGFDIVRRPTGGRAVWHEAEITYCAVVRADLLPPESRSVEGAYAWLSAGFVHGLASLGIGARMAKSGVRTNGTNCFAASAGCDFVVEGKKLIGAAQCRKDGAVLQHGSLLLSIDEPKWQTATGGAMDDATSLQALDVNYGRESVVEALCAGFAAQAGATWEFDGLGLRETDLAQLLFANKYRTSEWTLGAQVAEETQAAIDEMVQRAIAPGLWGRSNESVSDLSGAF